ncbi:hypothetical protein [Mesorhizobium ventifaucium]|uniref:SRPBCC domain-containing protein n=1 Tax=Mesorhizobium ventifaucium TaxID=666020 RepID=A0ABM9DTJ1_9HYPH|nr:hypothetical protein [Mesorhizobium ventifaucium]CAH2400009.1 hypothetical protein MES4922_230085 [Mesorhizobium ventifaucium]
MPIKKGETGKRWVEMEFITPGTPEQVWRAIATGPGNTAWFTKTTIDAPAPGIALIGTYDTDGSANPSMALYLYGDDAEQRAAEGEPKWRNWFGETFKHPG